MPLWHLEPSLPKHLTSTKRQTILTVGGNRNCIPRAPSAPAAVFTEPLKLHYLPFTQTTPPPLLHSRGG